MKDGITTHQRGYILIYKPEHKFCSIQGYVPQHRLIMEQKIGSIINPKLKEVHHIDKNVKNNNINNLQLLTRLEHVRIENGWSFENGKWFKFCPACKRKLEVNNVNFTKRNTGAEFVSECKKCVLVRVKIWKHKNGKNKRYRQLGKEKCCC